MGACADDDDDDVDEVSVVEESLLPSTSEHYACPQSEPVKRKVYEAQEPGRLLQRQQPPWLRNSDGDCASEQQLQTQVGHVYSYFVIAFRNSGCDLSTVTIVVFR